MAKYLYIYHTISAYWIRGTTPLELQLQMYTSVTKNHKHVHRSLVRTMICLAVLYISEQ